jgi:hypothetical protein
LAIEVDTSLSGPRVARVLDAIAAVRGYPETLVMDNELSVLVKGLCAKFESAGWL